MTDVKAMKINCPAGHKRTYVIDNKDVDMADFEPAYILMCNTCEDGFPFNESDLR